MRRFALVCVLAASSALCRSDRRRIDTGKRRSTDERLSSDITTTPDCGAGYVSDYTLATGTPYTDQTLDECTVSRGRENEPAVAVDPRNTQVLLGSSNDYCGVYNRGAAAGAVGPIWLGYYRSENQGASFTSSLVPGYPDDHSPYAALSQARTASAGDPVIAWDNQGRAFFGSESSGDPAGSVKTFGDVFVARFKNSGGSTMNDGKQYYGTTVIEKGSSAPNLLGKFNDKTAIEADRTGGACDGNVYFSWSRFTGNGGVGIYFSRSTDHGVTFSSPMKLTPSVHDVQFPDISVTGNGHVYVTFRQFDNGGKVANAVMITKSTDCGKTFSTPVLVTPFIENDAQDQSAPEALPQKQLDDPNFADEAGSEAGSSTARDCGDFADACTSGFTFFRRDTQIRSTADQLDSSREWVYIVYDATKPGTEQPTGSTYHTTDPGMGGQAGTFFVRYNGANGTHTDPVVIDNEASRSPGVPGHLGRRRRPARDVVGQPVRSVLQRDEADRQLRQPYDGAVAGRLRHQVRRPRSIVGAGNEGHGLQVEPELGAVRQPRGAVCRRLPLGDVARRLRLLGVDGLPQHRPGSRSARDDRGRGQHDRRRGAVPHVAAGQGQEGQHEHGLERRHLPARGRARPGHLRGHLTVGARASGGSTAKGRREAPLRFPPFGGAWPTRLRRYIMRTTSP